VAVEKGRRGWLNDWEIPSIEPRWGVAELDRGTFFIGAGETRR
jgi:hypothetical protein